jgi:hypothetical protein
MDYENARELLLRHLRYSGGVDLARAHETHHDDAVLEFPQSGERFVGKANILGFREQYPARVDYEPRQLRGGGDKVQRETIYFAEPFPAPDWRRPWAEEGATWERQGDLPARLPDRRG